jgi:hypothetical protein
MRRAMVLCLAALSLAACGARAQPTATPAAATSHLPQVLLGSFADENQRSVVWTFLPPADAFCVETVKTQGDCLRIDHTDSGALANYGTAGLLAPGLMQVVLTHHEDDKCLNVPLVIPFGLKQRNSQLTLDTHLTCIVGSPRGNLERVE